mgnify:CR=1 FL=1
MNSVETNIKKKKYEIDMTSGNLFSKIVKFCIPLMLMGILQLLYNAADLIIVSNFSDDQNALGAVGSTSSLINLTVNLFMGLSVGTNVLCASLYGSKSYDRVGRVVHTSILISFIIGLFLSVFGIIFASDLLHIMNNDLDLSRVYLQIYFIGMPFNLLYNFASSILRAVGDTKRPLYYLTIAGIINVLLNILFVISFDMSVAGVALGTIISQAVSAILVMITLIKTKESYGIKLNKLKIHKKELLEIAKVGLPAGIQSSIFSISNVLIQSSVNNFDKVASTIAGTTISTVKNGNSAATSVEGFVYAAMNSVYHAALAFTSQNVGAKKSKNIKKVMVYSLIYVTIVAASLGAILFIFGKQALSIYTTNPDEINVGYIRLHYLCLPYFLCGIMDVMVGIIRGLGYGLTPMIVSIVGVCGFRIFWILFIFQNNTSFTDYNDLNLLYISYPISWIITFTIHLITYFILSRKKYHELSNKLVLN